MLLGQRLRAEHAPAVLTFEATNRDYFLGLQLRFNDEDLKTILPFSGGAAAVGR